MKPLHEQFEKKYEAELLNKYGSIFKEDVVDWLRTAEAEIDKSAYERGRREEKKKIVYMIRNYGAQVHRCDNEDCDCTVVCGATGSAIADIISLIENEDNIYLTKESTMSDNIQTGLDESDLIEMFDWLFEKAEPLKNRKDIRDLISEWWIEKIREIRKEERANVVKYVSKYSMLEGDTSLEGKYVISEEEVLSFLANQK